LEGNSTQFILTKRKDMFIIIQNLQSHEIRIQYIQVNRIPLNGFEREFKATDQKAKGTRGDH
jgi:hypothetical protein